MDKLKPCPFCGSAAEIVYIQPFVHPKYGRKGIERWQAACKSCGVVSAGYLSEQAAVEAWNRRVVDG